MHSSSEIRSKLEDLSIEFILVDVDNPESFSNSITLLKDINNMSKKSGMHEITSCVKQIRNHIEQVTTYKKNENHDALIHIEDIISEMKLIVDHLTLGQQTDNEICKASNSNPPETASKSTNKNTSIRHPETLPSYLSMEDFAEFLSSQQSVLDKFETLVLEFEKGDLVHSPKEMKRIIHTIKGESGFLALKEVEKICHRTEDLFSQDVTVKFAEILFSVKDWLSDTFSVYSGADASPKDSEQILKLLKEYENKSGMEQKNQNDFASHHKMPSDTQPVKAEDAKSNTSVKKSIRVDSDRLDHLIDTIGELSTAEAMVIRNNDNKDKKSSEYRNSLRALSEITKELQRIGLSLRMVPLKALFNRMKRVARDLSNKNNKQFDFITKGEETELDKNLVDGLSDPLIHIIRNSVDHGIEQNIQDRLKAGKPEIATVTLEGYHKGGSLYIEITDDGKGIDTKKLIEKAISTRIIDDASQLDQNSIYNLIFHPGLSTADQVTDISGRGIGMDVVKTTINQYNGKIHIESTQKIGTKIQIKLPLTLAIMDGMIVGVGDHRYVIPTLCVLTSIELKPDMISSVFQKGEFIKVHGKIIPLFRLHKFFNLSNDISNGASNNNTGIVVVVEDSGFKAALLIDKLLAKQNVVRKNLGTLMENIPGICGGTIMPDGKVCLILDIARIISIANGIST
ncbi:chemotaxis protein CheA [Desulfobacula phenolica]|uniref:Chemotaxis protein CheA n=1 Tax=Desulfobacula phenolica TaxID=90732 RepID=A0A1H2H8S7_9BACT|nr:chemotaxis protein CheA [Desulfobacula phenolica]SDU28235.1 two-component system, chemotaxis family, sensor kinase CheA [Desulfobacula phenolica]